jgi:predicted dehydrogenase
MSIRPLNVGLIGGGGGKAFIVNPHQAAIFMGGTRRVVCGALHEKPEVALQSAADWPYPIRPYGNYDEMIAAEAKLPVGEKMDFAVIVTPNFVHKDPAIKCLKAGFPVFCEKPLALNVAEAEEIAKAVEETKLPFGLAHTYLGHWSTQFGRFIVMSGLLGNVRRVNAYYYQGWLASRTEDKGVQQAEWRVDPKRAGASCCGGDIGTHAFMHARYVTGLEVARILYAKLTTFVEGRQLDDDFFTVCQMSNDALAQICASQVMIGHKNDLGIEVNGDKGTLILRQEDSDEFTICLPDQPKRIYSRGDVKPSDGFLGDIPAFLLEGPIAPRIPSGHNEAFHDAFRRLYDAFELDVRAWLEGKVPMLAGERYASVYDGVKHMKFIEAAVRRSQMGLQAVVLE